MLKYSEMKDMDAKAIKDKVSELKRELFDMRFQKTLSGLEKPHLMKNAKKEVAKLLTALNERRGK